MTMRYQSQVLAVEESEDDDLAALARRMDQAIAEALKGVEVVPGVPVQVATAPFVLSAPAPALGGYPEGRRGRRRNGLLVTLVYPESGY